ncbi:ABC transporter permease [Rhizobium sp. KVB221]|uniref:ABC transporter permease n=1 Tax=Rhizobium setariae TaxID=2801340 RepID=A0A936YVP4_9HYPH|nr:ABC transporter permease [Rhizobium setariae]MBL0374277.1 ABC transporter permease [Rhizobium setariae]
MSVQTITASGASEPKRILSNFERDLYRLLRTPSFVVGFSIVMFWLLCAIFGPFIVHHDPFADNLLMSLKPPSWEHWFGTDQLGRDIFSRVLVGSRDILTVAPIATILSTVLGTTLGLVMGYYGGWVDEILSRLVDAILALPTIIVALLALTALGTSIITVVVVIAFTFSPIIARTVRSAVLTECSLDYIAVAELRHDSHFYILFAEILPNVIRPVLVETTVRLGYAIFTVATLSFIGFGIQPPSADWGLSISSNYVLMAGGFWWTVVFDGAAITSLVVAINLIADGLESLSYD